MIDMPRYLLLFALAVALCLSGRQAQAQGASEASFTQVTRPVAQLTDEAKIDELFSELLIGPQIPRDSISRIEVIDVTENGYGPDDLLVIYPSGNTYNIPETRGRAREIMSRWTLESDFQFDSANRPADSLRPSPPQGDTTESDVAEADTTDSDRTRPGAGPSQFVEKQMMADVLETVQRNYNGSSISLLLERDADGFTMEMWDYDPDAMQYEAPPTGPPDSVRTRDVVYVVRSDSVVYDVVYINKTVEETEYVPQGPTSSAPPAEEDGQARERIIQKTSESERR
jgi:hypothetical protein